MRLVSSSTGGKPDDFTDNNAYASATNPAPSGTVATAASTSREQPGGRNPDAGSAVIYAVALPVPTPTPTNPAFQVQDWNKSTQPGGAQGTRLSSSTFPVPIPGHLVAAPTATPAPTPAASADAAYFFELGRIADMGTDLSRADIEALYRLLAQPSHPLLGHVEFHSVKNQALDKLLDQSPLPSDLGQTLVDLFRDRRHDELLRNYSLQHFEPYLRSVSSEQWAVGSEQAIAAVFAAYREALGESRNSIAGVALLGLERATASDAPLAGHPDRSLALRTAARLAGDASCDPRSRLAAVQVCAVVGQTGALPAIRSLAADPATMTALRATALHALGELGDASDLSLLRALSASGPPHAARIASSAAQALQRRTAQ